MAGYVLSEVAKEAPYYAGAFGTALVSESVNATDALNFLVGTNLGAALDEYGAARLTAAFLARRERPISTVGPISVDVGPSPRIVGTGR